MSEAVGGLRRAAMDEVPKNKRWDVSGVWEVELERAKRFLHETASLNFGKFQNVDAALAAGGGLTQEIFARFGGEGMAVDTEIMDEASRGTLQRQAPSTRLLAIFGILKWITMLCETLLFVFLAVMGFSNYVVIIIGILLAFGGYLIGHGIGDILVGHELGKGMGSGRGWLYAIVGSVGVVSLSVLRASGSEEGALAAVIIPVVLALTIALFEALDFVGSWKYKILHEKMFKAQVWFALSQHQRKFQEDLWGDIYKGEVRRSANSFNNFGQASSS